MTLPFVADGYGFDRALAAMFFGAKKGETVSIMAAEAQVAGERWGCWLCWLLSRIVERDHCALALKTGDVPTARAAAYRAGALLLIVLCSFVTLFWALVDCVERFL